MQAGCWLWAAPCTLVGALALLPLLACGARAGLHRGVVEACLPADGAGHAIAAALARHLPFEAITLGHVVLARSPQAMARWRAHERAHVRQCECWGPLFFPAYLAAGLWQWLRGREAYRDNPFEVQARAAEAALESQRPRALTAAGCAPAAGSSRTSA